MRLLVILLGVFAGAVAIGTSAMAQDYPWCSNFADGWGGTNCGFTSYEQCRATILGSGGFCAQNNTYKPPGAAAQPPRPTRNHRSHKNF
jgi:hypothetical protein